MIISEKPTAARRIAEALDDTSSPVEIKKRKASYFECKRGRDTLLVVYALGHLYDLRQTVKGWTYPRLDMEWAPKHEIVKKAAETKYIINLIKRLSKDVDSFVVATDYDIEGSLIGYLTLRYACKADPKSAKRMYFSALTKTDLEAAYQGLEPQLEFPMIEAGCVRHEIDWLWGINLTRALTLAIKRVSGWFKIVSTGRVQGPALAYVAEREREINVFVPTPFWVIQTTGEYDGGEVELEYFRKRVQNKQQADTIVDELSGKTAIVDSVNRRVVSQSPPVPFNLSGLQSEAYRHFGFKPSRTLAIAQKLYLDALISYPRTSSQKIPKSINVKLILDGLSTNKTYSALAKQVLQGELVPIQGKMDDPAHPAIHPTGKKPERRLTPSQKKVYDLIVRRFLSLFGEPAVKESLRVDVIHDEHKLYLRGLRVLKEGWMSFYEPYVVTSERVLPSLDTGDLIRLTSVAADWRYTAPPPRFNPSSLLKKLEVENLGTKSTRASIVDSVKSRGYTLSERFELSTLGYATFETLNRYVPKMLSVDLTRQLEAEMAQIQERKNSRGAVLKKAKEELLTLLESIREQEELIGQELVAGLQRYWKAKQEIGPCPSCDNGTLIVVRSPKSGKRFLGCSNYRDGNCEVTFPLPQKGEIVPLDKQCPDCGFQIIRVVSRKRAWETCINWSECPGRREDLKALEKRRGKMAEEVDSDE